MGLLVVYLVVVFSLPAGAQLDPAASWSSAESDSTRSIAVGDWDGDGDLEPVGVYRNVGYKLGAWHDVGWWQHSLQEQRPSAPPPPRPLREIRDNVALF